MHQRSLSSFLKTAEILRVSGLTQQQAEETHNVSFFSKLFIFLCACVHLNIWSVCVYVRREKIRKKKLNRKMCIFSLLEIVCVYA